MSRHLASRGRLVLLLAGLGCFVSGASSLVACGGDDAAAGDDDAGGLPDTSVTPDASGDDAGSDTGAGDTGAAPQANASDVSIYLGQVAQLDGSASAPPGATLAWTIDSVPAGSAITTASLLNPSGAKPTFTPDKSGDYKLTLTVTSGSANATKAVTVHAFDAPIFYVGNADQGDGGFRVDFRYVSAAGTGRHDVTCGVVESNLGAVIRSAVLVSGGADWWEGPPGTEARLVFDDSEQFADGGNAVFVGAATATSTCDGGSNAPRQLDVVAQGGKNNAQGVKLSPDGTRVAYLRTDDVGTQVATIGFDGMNPHTHISPAMAYPDGGPQVDGSTFNTQFLPPRWSGTKVTWGQTAGSRFQIVIADDADNATTSIALACDGALGDYAPLANGDFVVAANVTLADAGTARNLYVLHPNSLTRECEVVRNLTKLPDGSTVNEISLAPDATRIAYLAKDATVDAGNGASNSALYVAAIDGSSAPVRVAGVPYGAGTGGANFTAGGPRWVAGGTALTFSQPGDSIDAGTDGGAFAAVAVTPVAGGGVRAVATSGSGDNVSAIGNSCSIGRAGGSALMGVGSLAALLGLVARRRRKDAR